MNCLRACVAAYSLSNTVYSRSLVVLCLLGRFSTGALTPSPKHRTMKKTLFTLLAAATSCFANIDAQNITTEDIIWESSHLPNNGVNVDPAGTRGKDCIVTAVFGKHNDWEHIVQDNESYVGIEREHDKQAAYAWSCVGAVFGNTTRTGAVLDLAFNRADPGSKIADAVVHDTDTTPYKALLPDGQFGAITLKDIYDNLVGGNHVALSILRTPSEHSLDMFAVTIYNESDESFKDYVVGCEIASTGDEVGIMKIKIDHTRFDSGITFIGDAYGIQDIIAANRYALTGNMPIPVPEPATATLSLLALAGLCARRRH